MQFILLTALPAVGTQAMGFEGGAESLIFLGVFLPAQAAILNAVFCERRCPEHPPAELRRQWTQAESAARFPAAFLQLSAPWLRAGQRGRGAPRAGMASAVPAAKIHPGLAQLPGRMAEAPTKSKALLPQVLRRRTASAA